MLDQIEGLLGPMWDAEMRAQTDRLITHKVGDLLWRERVGWAVCLVETRAKTGQPIKVRLRGIEKDIVNGYYVNVTELAARDAALSELINQLREAISVGT